MKTQHSSVTSAVLNESRGNRCIYRWAINSINGPVIGEGNPLYNPFNFLGEKVRRVLCLPPCKRCFAFEYEFSYCDLEWTNNGFRVKAPIFGHLQKKLMP